MPLRPCLGSSVARPGHVLVQDANRCPACGRAVQRAKDARRPARLSRAEQTRRRAAVTAHVTARGWVCPGYQRPAHPSTDLTADHVAAVAAGGPESGPLQVLCRRCNSARGARGDALPQ